MRSAVLLLPLLLAIGCSSDPSARGDDADATDTATDGGGVADAAEGSFDFPPGQPDVDELPGSDVSGFVVRVEGALAIADSATAGEVVAGATVRMVDHDGDPIGETTTAADGRFGFDDVARGPVAASAHVGDEESAPLWFSSLPDSSFVLGVAWPVDRTTAGSLAGVRDASLDLVLGTLQPLPAGTLVAPRREDPDTSDFAVRVDAPAWFFVFDGEPFARQQHSLRYVFVDAVSGEVQSIESAPEWPRINRGVYFTDDVMWASFASVDWDEAFETGEIAPDAEATLSPEAVSLPPVLPDELTNNGGPRPKPGDAGARDVFVAMLIAGNDSASSADRVRMWGWCNREGIPLGNRRIVIPHEVARIRDVPAQWAAALRELEERVVAALEEGRHPTLLVYITGHGLLENGTPARQLRVDWKDREMEWGAANIDVGSLISNTSACRLRVVVDVCYAETLTTDLEVRTTRRPRQERPDFFSLASSVSDQKSIMIPGWLNAIAGAGSVFTKRFAEHVTIVDGDLAGALATGNQQIHDNLDPAGQTPIAHVSSNWPTRCDGGAGDDTGLPMDAGGDTTEGDAGAPDVSDASDPETTDVADASDAAGAPRRFATLGAPERAFVVNVGGLPWDPPFAERDPGAPHAIVASANGVDLVDLATGARVTNPYAPASFAAVPFRDPNGYDSFLLPGPEGLAQTSWNAEFHDFGFTQVPPSPTAVFDVDVFVPGPGGVSPAYTYAASNPAMGDGYIYRQTYDAEAGYMRLSGEVRGGAFPEGVWPAAPFGAYFGRTSDEVIVTLLDGSVWWGEFSAPFSGEASPLTLLFESEGEPRGLRCARTGGAAVCVLPSYEGSALHVLELSPGATERTASFDVPAGPVGVAIQDLGGGLFEIAATSFGTGAVGLWTYSAFERAASQVGSADVCPGAAHVDFAGGSELLVTCNASDELVLVPRRLLR